MGWVIDRLRGDGPPSDDEVGRVINAMSRLPDEGGEWWCVFPDGSKASEMGIVLALTKKIEESKGDHAFRERMMGMTLALPMKDYFEGQMAIRLVGRLENQLRQLAQKGEKDVLLAKLSKENRENAKRASKEAERAKVATAREEELRKMNERLQRAVDIMAVAYEEERAQVNFEARDE